MIGVCQLYLVQIPVVGLTVRLILVHLKTRTVPFVVSSGRACLDHLPVQYFKTRPGRSQSLTVLAHPSTMVHSNPTLDLCKKQEL
jgi:hypothetical protein